MLLTTNVSDCSLTTYLISFPPKYPILQYPLLVITVFLLFTMVVFSVGETKPLHEKRTERECVILLICGFSLIFSSASLPVPFTPFHSYTRGYISKMGVKTTPSSFSNWYGDIREIKVHNWKKRA